MYRIVVLTGLLLAATVGLEGGNNLSAQGSKRGGPDPKEWNETVDRAVAFLKSRQAEDGSWSKQANPGITPVVLFALLRSGKVTAKDPVVEKSLKYIEALADPDAGHLAGKGGKGRLHNYLTSVNLLALLEADRQQYASLSDKAVKFLKTLPYDESQGGKDRKDAFYGGVGYDATTRPDMSNTVFFLEAMRAAKVPADDPVYRKVLVYVSRSQNLKSEHNDQPWADKINDGSFHYGAGPAGAPRTKGAPPDAPRPGYGSITCSGLVALDDCGVKKDDPRYRKALEWIQKEYTVENNPGTGGQRGYYLYLRMLTAALDRAGLDSVTDGQKKTRDWRAEVAATLMARQNKDGSWANKTPVWMEGNPDLATAWALLALSHCKPNGK